MQNNSPTYLFLFDIDGTLILGRGAGEKSLRKAMLRKFGTCENFSEVTLAGATDIAIAIRLLQVHSLPVTPENVAALLETYLEILHETLPECGGQLLPGIVELLDALLQRKDCALGLLTGNLRKGAELKLTHFGVWHYFPFGAFADDCADRNLLGPFARTRAEIHHNSSFAPENIFVLGDTPKDIACGKALGAKTVAIATGDYPPSELAKYNPDFLFENLANTNFILNTLLKTQH
ncbi:MAG: HAD hydrolase-like protein [Chthoniobacterales bacterium]|nr:HAD hydrolase-like protein [Chthoniobacterales bacterium]